MMGISADVLTCIKHFLFTLSRMKPKINLRRMIIKNGDAEANGMHSKRYSISGNTLSFRYDEGITTVFIKPVITSVWLTVFRFLFSCG
jgi:hypothetical protein